MEDQGEAGIGGLLAPSPQSEAVTHELGELSLHPSQRLPPLNERKNGMSVAMMLNKNGWIESFTWISDALYHYDQLLIKIEYPSEK